MSRGVIIGGVLFLMLLVIGVIVYFMMSGDSDDSTTTPTGPGPSSPSPTPVPQKTHSTPVVGKIYHTNAALGWTDPGPKSAPGHISGTSIKDCYDKAPEGAVIAGWRAGDYADADYQNTCFYYDRSQSGEPTRVIDKHTIACIDSTKDVSKGCGVPRTTGLFYGTGAELGWKDPGPVSTGIKSKSLEGCIDQAPADAVIVGHRDGAYPDANYRNTCFYYTKAQSGAPTVAITGHHMTCKNQSKSMSTGCA